MFQNNSTTNNATANDSMPGAMPGAMPGSMPGSIPQDTNNTQFHQQDPHPKIIGGPNKIQAGLNQALGDKNYSLENSNQSGNPLEADGHRSLQSHHRGLNNNEHHSGHDSSLAGAAAGIAGSELNKHHNNQQYNTNNSHMGGINNNNPNHEHHYGNEATNFAKHELGNHSNTGFTNPTNTSNHSNDHHFVRDAALGTGAAGLAKHELGNHTSDSHHQGLNPTSISHQNNSNPIHSSGLNNNNNDHHYVRDAALGAGTAGAAGLAKHEYDNHNKNASDPLKSSHNGNSGPLNDISHHDNTSHLGHTSATGSHNSNDHHYGRDAALGAGAAGAAGLAKHEYDNHNKNSSDPMRTSHFGSSNPLNNTSHHDDSGITGSEHHPETDSHNSNDHHYARNAALGAGAAGAAGLAKHEYDNHNKNSSDPMKSSHYGSSNPLNNTSHHDGSGITRSEHRPETDSHNNNDHHYARDAALGTGAVGAAGLAKHEYDNHNKNSSDPLKSSHYGSSNPLNNTSHHDGSGITGSEHRPGTDSHNSNDHHYARDAALGTGAVGAAGLAKHEYDNHNKNSSDPLKSSHFDSANPLNNASHHDGSGITRSEHSPDTGSHNSNEHHYARNAALGAGAAGAAGLAKHEYDSRNKNSSNPLDNTSHHDGRNDILPGHTSVADSHNDKDHHYARNAALGAGTAGAAGLAKHEYDNHKHNDSKSSGISHQGGSNPISSEHSPMSNSSQSDDHHYGRDAALGAGAAGAAGLAKHEYDNHNKNSSDPMKSSHFGSSNPLNNTSHHDGSGITRSEHRPETDSHNSNDHHYARNAALGAGAAGAAGLAKHEYDNHNKNSSDPTKSSHYGSSNPLNNTSHHDGSGITGSEHRPETDSHNSNDHHYARNAALGAGAAGAAGLAKHEYDNHKDKDSKSSNISDHNGSNPIHSEHSPMTNSSHGDNHHYGRDAALGAGAAGAAGAAGLAKHEYDNHNKNNETHNSREINDKDHHLGRDAAAAGGAAVAGKELKDHHDNKRNSTVSNENAEEHGKPLNTGGNANYIAEQPLLYTDGGLTGKQPVGEVNFKKL